MGCDIIKNTKKIILIVILLIAVAALGFSAYKISYYYRQAQSVTEYRDYLFDKAFSKSTENESKAVESEENTETGNREVYYFDYSSIQEDNPDIVAWLYSENTPISYPVLQGADNNQYLRTAVDGSYNIAGSLFLDYRNNSNFSDFISIIYGHNMNNDSMFGTITQYESQEYYEKHSDIDLYTTDKLLNLDVVSGFLADFASPIYSFELYSDNRQSFIDFIKVKSDFTPKVDYSADDNFVVLSTCSYDYDDARYVLVCKACK